jgi:uncharacterized membrane protein (DUF485 family)
MTQVVQPPISNRPAAPPGTGFGGITRQPSSAPVTPGAPDFAAIQSSPEFVELRSRFRRFVFPMSALFFLWYLTYVLLAAFAREFMSRQLFGSVNVGLVLGLLQFVSTIAITIAYLRFARSTIDPRVAAIRAAAGMSTGADEK